MQDPILLTVTSFIYEKQVNSKNLSHYNNTCMEGKIKVNFFVMMDAFLSCDKTLRAIFQLLSIH